MAKDVSKKPSKEAKERMAQLLEQDVHELGRVARQLCQNSGSREVLMKAAKKMANQESSMENTLSSMRQIERILDQSLLIVNEVEKSMETTTLVQEQLSVLQGE